MNFFDSFFELENIIFPKFYTVADSDNNEYVFLQNGEKIKTLSHVQDKTQLEAYENHFHIFGKIQQKYKKQALKAAELITENLIKQLTSQFPDKKFHVYLSCDIKDHVIIRFHQHWNDEHPYYDVNEFPEIKEFVF